MEPQDVAGKEFLIGMRGYIREDVRSYLRAVAEELFRRDELMSGLRQKLEKANRELEEVTRQLDEAKWQLEEANGQRDVDRATLVKLVGEEASAILSSADGAAERIRLEAERYAEAVRQGLVSTTDHLAELQRNLGRLLAELQAMEEQGRGRPEPPRADVDLLEADGESSAHDEISLEEEGGEEGPPAPAEDEPDPSWRWIR